MPPKRKVQSIGLDRRVRARRDENWELESESDGQHSDDVSEEEMEQDSREEEQSDAEETEESEPESEDDAPPKVDLSSISFGALARAQASIPATGRRAKKHKPDESEPLEERKPSLREAAEARRSKSRDAPKKPAGRTSKHAPQEQSSKKPVSRRREILQDPRRSKARDPRFDPLMGPVDEAKTRRAYAFLDEYRDGEMADLKAQIKKTKDPGPREALKRRLLSMESRRTAQKKRDEADALLREHRNREKELVAQGKQPFYLKKSEQKKQLLTNRFADMSKGQVDRAIQRKRKKMAGKERKELDGLVRVRDRR